MRRRAIFPAVSTPSGSFIALSLTPDGRVLYRLRAPFRDGTSHFVFDPLPFLERIAPLVPRPTHQLADSTWHGVLAPAAGWRDLIVPRPPDPEPSPAPEVDAGAGDLLSPREESP